MRVRIKFCGITNVDDALAAVALGVDALGFVFHAASPRHVTPAVAAAIIERLPPLVCKVGLFVNAPAATLRETIAQTGIDVVQFHGDETPAACRDAPRAWIKAIRVQAHTDIAAATRGYAGAAAILLDAWDKTVYGGSGNTFDWARVPAELGRPLILAGGLTPENVSEAIRRTRPFAVDVSGGIEAAKGLKDREKMQKFVTEVHNVECHT
ncbi:MAG: phosphoribosylanthranilate isomerase [Gammaproteobacteria bacterium]